MLPCPDIFAVSDTLLLHMRFTLRRRDIPVSRKSFSRYSAQHLRVLIDNKCYRRVRRPRRTVSNGWYNLSRKGEQCSPTPRQITRYENRLHLIKNGERKTLTVILHSPFSILNFSRCLETHSANKAHASVSSPTKTLSRAPSRRPALRCRSVLRRRQVRR